MKTRQEMIYDFMLQLAANPAYYIEDMKMGILAKGIRVMATELVDSYLEGIN
jgi:hypothetical protein